MFRNPLIVAADTEDPDQAETWAKELASLVSHVKVGLTLFTAAGPLAVERVRQHAPVFLDLKLHDIPKQVEGAARAAARLGPSLLTVHALGGEEMVRAAVEGAARGAEEAGVEPPLILAVTVLSRPYERWWARPSRWWSPASARADSRPTTTSACFRRARPSSGGPTSS